MEDRFGIPGLSVWASRQEDGSFRIEALHLRGEQGDYEYTITVAADDVPKLAVALGCDVAGLDAAWTAQEREIVRRGERSWLEEHGVPCSLWVQ